MGLVLRLIRAQKRVCRSRSGISVDVQRGKREKIPPLIFYALPEGRRSIYSSGIFA